MTALGPEDHVSTSSEASNGLSRIVGVGGTATRFGSVHIKRRQIVHASVVQEELNAALVSAVAFPLYMLDRNSEVSASRQERRHAQQQS